MSGHNKWSQIKLKKGKTDAKKSQIFSKYAKLITNEARSNCISKKLTNRSVIAFFHRHIHITLE